GGRPFRLPRLRERPLKRADRLPGVAEPDRGHADRASAATLAAKSSRNTVAAAGTAQALADDRVAARIGLGAPLLCEYTITSHMS
ncbi:MAG: hypothetical protein ACR2MK_12590, partial [Solirubrobacteraceae bacterium]